MPCWAVTPSSWKALLLKGLNWQGHSGLGAPVGADSEGLEEEGREWLPLCWLKFYLNAYFKSSQVIKEIALARNY